MRFSRVILFLFSFGLLGISETLPRAETSEESLKISYILFPQPDDVLQEIIPSAKALVDYIHAIEGSVRTALLTAETHTENSGFIVVAIKRNKGSKIWLDFDQDLPQALEREILKNALAVQPLGIYSGVFVFIMKVRLWGGPESKRKTPEIAEWGNVVQKAGHPLRTDELLEKLFE